MGDVRVVHMGTVEQLPQLFAGGGWLYLVDRIGGLTRGQVMGARSDTADARHNTRQFFYRSAFAKPLKATQLRYLEIGIGNITIVVKENLYLAVSLQPGYRVNGNLLHGTHSLKPT